MNTIIEEEIIEYISEGSKNIEQWETRIIDVLSLLNVEQRLPEGSLRLAANRGKKDNKITSYTVCIIEPAYPDFLNIGNNKDGRTSVMRIRELPKNRLEINIGRDIFNNVNCKKSDEVEIKDLKSDPIYMKVLISQDNEAIKEYVRKCVEIKLDNYIAKAQAFACCSRYSECSDAKVCVLENRLYAEACTYKHNLDKGKVFYGKNRNV